MPSSANIIFHKSRGRLALTDEEKAMNARIRAERASKAHAAATKQAPAFIFGSTLH